MQNISDQTTLAKETTLEIAIGYFKIFFFSALLFYNNNSDFYVNCFLFIDSLKCNLEKLLCTPFFSILYCCSFAQRLHKAERMPATQQCNDNHKKSY